MACACSTWAYTSPACEIESAELTTRARPDDTDLIMLCYSVDSKDSLENVESKWVGEIADNCPGVKLVLVALKCDLREGAEDDDDAANEDGTPRERSR